MRRASQWLLSLIFPPSCLHCGQPTLKGEHFLCPLCSELLELLKPTGRCPRCFEEVALAKSRICRLCRARPSGLRRAAASLPAFGPAQTLVNTLMRHRNDRLARGLAAFLTVQHLNLGWPAPDLIVPTPQTALKQLIYGKSAAQQLAGLCAEMLSCPASNLLVRRESIYPYEGSMALRSSAKIADKVILLIEPIQSTRAALDSCASALARGFPSAIYALSVCREEP